MKIENLSTLKIHKLDQEQFKREKLAGKLDETAFYLTPEDGIELDSTLTQEGRAADAKAVGDAIANISTEQPDWNQNDSSAPGYVAVDAEIRKRYSVSQEFAILRQRDEKPEEYTTYYAYCEECKAYVKS